MDPELTCHDRAVLLLREVDPDLAETVNAVAPSGDGEVMVGLLGWLPLTERMRVARAVTITHANGDCDWSPPPSPELARIMGDDDAAWRNPLSEECRTRMMAGIRTWTALGRPGPRLS